MKVLLSWILRKGGVWGKRRKTSFFDDLCKTFWICNNKNSCCEAFFDNLQNFCLNALRRRQWRSHKHINRQEWTVCIYANAKITDFSPLLGKPCAVWKHKNWGCLYETKWPRGQGVIWLPLDFFQHLPSLVAMLSGIPSVNQKLVACFNQISYSGEWCYQEPISFVQWRHAWHNLITINGKTVIT